MDFNGHAYLQATFSAFFLKESPFVCWMLDNMFHVKVLKAKHNERDIPKAWAKHQEASIRRTLGAISTCSMFICGSTWYEKRVAWTTYGHYSNGSNHVLNLKKSIAVGE